MLREAEKYYFKGMVVKLCNKLLNFLNNAPKFVKEINNSC